ALRARRQAAAVFPPPAARPGCGAARVCWRESFAGRSSWGVAKKLSFKLPPRINEGVPGEDGLKARGVERAGRFQVEGRAHRAADGVTINDAVGLHLVDGGNDFANVHGGLSLASCITCGDGLFMRVSGEVCAVAPWFQRGRARSTPRPRSTPPTLARRSAARSR